jgi:hypothetical protein
MITRLEILDDPNGQFTNEYAKLGTKQNKFSRSISLTLVNLYKHALVSLSCYYYLSTWIKLYGRQPLPISFRST